MTHVHHITEISRTPWGTAQSHDVVAPGITFVYTASHGGVYLCPWRLALMRQDSPELLAPSDFYPSRMGGAWFEEDCEAGRVILAFPKDFSYAAINAAYNGLKCFHPQMIERWKN